MQNQEGPEQESPELPTAAESPILQDDVSIDEKAPETKPQLDKQSDAEATSENHEVKEAIGGASPVFEQSAHKGSDLKSEETQTDLQGL